MSGSAGVAKDKIDQRRGVSPDDDNDKQTRAAATNFKAAAKPAETAAPRPATAQPVAARTGSPEAARAELATGTVDRIPIDTAGGERLNTPLAGALRSVGDGVKRFGAFMYGAAESTADFGFRTVAAYASTPPAGDPLAQAALGGLFPETAEFNRRAYGELASNSQQAITQGLKAAEATVIRDDPKLKMMKDFGYGTAVAVDFTELGVRGLTFAANNGPKLASLATKNLDNLTNAMKSIPSQADNLLLGVLKADNAVTRFGDKALDGLITNFDNRTGGRPVGRQLAFETVPVSGGNVGDEAARRAVDVGRDVLFFQPGLIVDRGKKVLQGASTVGKKIMGDVEGLNRDIKTSRLGTPKEQVAGAQKLKDEMIALQGKNGGFLSPLPKGQTPDDAVGLIRQRNQQLRDDFAASSHGQDARVGVEYQTALAKHETAAIKIVEDFNLDINPYSATVHDPVTGRKQNMDVVKVGEEGKIFVDQSWFISELSKGAASGDPLAFKIKSSFSNTGSVEIPDYHFKMVVPTDRFPEGTNPGTLSINFKRIVSGVNDPHGEFFFQPFKTDPNVPLEKHLQARWWAAGIDLANEFGVVPEEVSRFQYGSHLMETVATPRTYAPQIERGGRTSNVHARTGSGKIPYFDDMGRFVPNRANAAQFTGAQIRSIPAVTAADSSFLDKMMSVAEAKFKSQISIASAIVTGGSVSVAASSFAASRVAENQRANERIEDDRIASRKRKEDEYLSISEPAYNDATSGLAEQRDLYTERYKQTGSKADLDKALAFANEVQVNTQLAGRFFEAGIAGPRLQQQIMREAIYALPYEDRLKMAKGTLADTQNPDGSASVASGIRAWLTSNNDTRVPDGLVLGAAREDWYLSDIEIKELEKEFGPEWRTVPKAYFESPRGRPSWVTDDYHAATAKIAEINALRDQ
jgi:hypothetical protein